MHLGHRAGGGALPVAGRAEGDKIRASASRSLVSIEEDDGIDGLLVMLNTMGGDVEAGLAIAEIIASMTKPSVSLVLGGSHSIGVPLAAAAKRSLIVPSATMTLHPVRVNGMIIGVEQSFRYMREMQDRIVRFICSHSRAKAEKINELMMRPDQMATDCGTILEAEEAVALRHHRRGRRTGSRPCNSARNEGKTLGK